MKYGVFALCLLFFCSLTAPMQTHDNVQELEGLVKRYEEMLGVYAHPFDKAFTHTEVIFLYRHFTHISPLFHAIEEARKRLTYADIYDEEIIHEVLKSTRKQLELVEQSVSDLQVGLLALRSCLEYVKHKPSASKTRVPYSSTHEPPPQIPRLYTQVTTHEHELKRENTTYPTLLAFLLQKIASGISAPLSYPDVSSYYKPFTKNILEEEKRVNQGNSVFVLGTNLSERQFGNVIYSTIVRSSGFPLQTAPFEPAQEVETLEATFLKYFMVLNPLGRQRLKLLIPSGYRPCRPLLEEATIASDGRGSYTLSLTKPRKEVIIPLEKKPKEVLTPEQKALFTAPVGFALEEWPEEIHVNIIQKYKDIGDHCVIAKAIKEHITQTYAYTKLSRPETDIIDALKAGYFQCDMAAYIMVALLRDIFFIPSRVVAGYTANGNNCQEGFQSCLFFPHMGHAWVEVFHDGEWHAYDPTPPCKDEACPPEEEQNSPHVDFNFNFFSQNNETVKNYLFLEKYLNKFFVPFALNPYIDNKGGLKRGLMASVTKAKDSSITKLCDAMGIRGELKEYEEREGIYKDIFAGVIAFAKKDSITAYHYLTYLSRLMELYKGIISHDSYRVEHIQAIEEIRGISNLLEPLRKAADNELIKQFKRVVPLQLTSVIEKEYRAHNENVETAWQKWASAIKRGKHDDMLMIGALQKHIDGILRTSSQVPVQVSKKQIPSGIDKEKNKSIFLDSVTFDRQNGFKTWLRDDLVVRGRDLLLAQRPSEWSRALSTRPDLNVFENIEQGYAYVLAKRKKIAQTELKDRLRVTILAYNDFKLRDTTDFDIYLAASLAYKALNDSLKAGEQNHKIALLSLRNREITEIESFDDIFDFIRDNQNRTIMNNPDLKKFNIDLKQAQDIASACSVNNLGPSAVHLILVTHCSTATNLLDRIWKDPKFSCEEYDSLCEEAKRFFDITAINIAESSTEQYCTTFMHSQNRNYHKAPRLYYTYFYQEHIKNIEKEAYALRLKNYDDAYAFKQGADSIRKNIENKVEKLDRIFRNLKVLEDPYIYRKYLNNAKTQTRDIQSTLDMDAVFYHLKHFTTNLDIDWKIDPLFIHFVFNNFILDFEHLFGIPLNELSSLELNSLLIYLDNLVEERAIVANLR